MKYIYFLRHAKSDWSHIKKNIYLKDFDRPLSISGISRAKIIKNFLQNQKTKIDLITCSSSKRTIETLRIIKPSIKTNNIDLSNELYTFDFLKLIEIIYKFSDDYKKIMIIGHNPAIHFSINFFLNKEINKKNEKVLKKKFPTASLAILQFNEKSWKKLKKNSGIISDLIIPKKS